MSKDIRQIRINERIRVPQVRLVGADGGQLGVVETKEAIQKAEDAGFDLVEVAPNSSPPVCRIMDYSKFIYQMKKKEKEARKNQKTAAVKEVKFSVKIGEHDYEIKVNHARGFLEKGHKVKTTMFLRGREIMRAEDGIALMKRLATDLEEYGTPERAPNLDGKIISVMFAPKSGKNPSSKGKVEQNGDKI